MAQILLALGMANAERVAEILPSELRTFRFLSHWSVGSRSVMVTHDRGGLTDFSNALPNQTKGEFSKVDFLESPSKWAADAAKCVADSGKEFEVIHSLAMQSLLFPVLEKCLSDLSGSLSPGGVIVLALKVSSLHEKRSKRRHRAEAIFRAAENAGLLAHFLPMAYPGIWDGRAFVVFRKL